MNAPYTPRLTDRTPPPGTLPEAWLQWHVVLQALKDLHRGPGPPPAARGPKPGRWRGYFDAARFIECDPACDRILAALGVSRSLFRRVAYHPRLRARLLKMEGA